MKFKKVLSVLVALGLVTVMAAGCSSSGGGSASGSDDKTIVVGASPTPHAEILKAAENVLKEKGYTLKITEFQDYVQPNMALENKELDANYFQHKPYLDEFNEKMALNWYQPGQFIMNHLVYMLEKQNRLLS